MTATELRPQGFSGMPRGLRELVASPKRRALWSIGIVSALLHLATMARGSVFSGSEIVGDIHLLPFSVLRDHPLAALTHLHAQPPLFNLATALLLPLPRGVAAVLVNVVFLACTVSVALAAAGMLLDASVRIWLTVTVVVVGIVLDPAFILYQTHWSYTLPTAALASLSG